MMSAWDRQSSRLLPVFTTKWILDPDYGVVIEHDLDQITDNSDIIRDAYAAQGYSQDVM